MRYVSTTVLQNHMPAYKVWNDTYCAHRPAIYPEPGIKPWEIVERRRFYLQKARASTWNPWSSEELEHAFPS